MGRGVNGRSRGASLIATERTVLFPESRPKHRAARKRLLEEGIELRRPMEAVAASRRTLPPGGMVLQDYVFQGGFVPLGSPVAISNTAWTKPEPVAV